MSARWVALAPSLLFALAVLWARLSGNDKAPYLVIAVLALSGIGAVVALVAAWRAVASRESPAAAWWCCLGFALPVLYAAGVAVAARSGAIDPLAWLGFR